MYTSSWWKILEYYPSTLPAATHPLLLRSHAHRSTPAAAEGGGDRGGSPRQTPSTAPWARGAACRMRKAATAGKRRGVTAKSAVLQKKENPWHHKQNLTPSNFLVTWNNTTKNVSWNDRKTCCGWRTARLFYFSRFLSLCGRLLFTLYPVSKNWRCMLWYTLQMGANSTVDTAARRRLPGVSESKNRPAPLLSSVLHKAIRAYN